MKPSTRQHVGEIATLLCIALCASATAATGPRLSVFPDKIDYGVQPRGHLLQGAFELRNVGDQPLEIKEVETSCGCLAATYEKVVIQPGEIFSFGFSLNTAELGDAILKLKLNDPTQPQVILPIHIRVLSEVDMDGTSIAFRHVPRGESPASTITAWPAKQDGPLVGIRSLTTTLASLKLARKECWDSTRQGMAVVATLDTEGMPLGPFWGIVEIEFDLPKHPVLKVDVSGEVVSDLVLVPNPLSISMSKSNLSSLRPRVVTLRSVSGQPFRVLRAETSQPWLTAGAETKASLSQHRIAIRVSREAPMTGESAAKVRLDIFTDAVADPHVGTVYVRIDGAARDGSPASRTPHVFWAACAATVLLAAAIAAVLKRRK